MKKAIGITVAGIALLGCVAGFGYLVLVSGKALVKSIAAISEPVVKPAATNETHQPEPSVGDYAGFAKGLVSAVEQELRVRNPPKTLPYTITLGGPGETNRFLVTITNNIVILEDMPTNSVSSVQVSPSIWIRHNAFTNLSNVQINGDAVGNVIGNGNNVSMNK